MVLEVGQIVVWPPAPGRIAQIDELCRRNVRIVYRTKTGRTRRPSVSASQIAELLAAETDKPLPLSNPFGRGVRRKSKVFNV